MLTNGLLLKQLSQTDEDNLARQKTIMDLITKGMSKKAIDDEKKIVGFANSIDDCIKDLDIEMDQVLERHEHDFLQAYRKHMIAVQRELQELKAKGTETELQFR
jgi:hypothetical protein